LNKMITNVFKLQPKYNDDLCESVLVVTAVLARMAHERCGVSLDDPRVGEGSQVTRLTEAGFLDLALYFLDVGATLRQLFAVYPTAAGVYLENNFLITLARFYHHLAPVIMSSVSRPSENALARRALYSVLQAADTLLQLALSPASVPQATQCLHYLSELLDLPFFLKDLCGCFPLIPRVLALRTMFTSLDPLLLGPVEAAVSHLDGVWLRAAVPCV
jgi:hypothetical protein